MRCSGYVGYPPAPLTRFARYTEAGRMRSRWPDNGPNHPERVDGLYAKSSNA
jgi:hypothetical protein